MTRICLRPARHTLEVFEVSVAQTITINPVGDVTVAEGTNLAINCTDGVNTIDVLVLCENAMSNQ